MTNAPNTSTDMSVSKSAATAETRKLILKEIGTKWGKFSEQNLTDLKGKEDLVDQVAKKYDLEKAQAQRDVDGLLKGRQI